MKPSKHTGWIYDYVPILQEPVDLDVRMSTVCPIDKDAVDQKMQKKLVSPHKKQRPSLSLMPTTPRSSSLLTISNSNNTCIDGPDDDFGFSDKNALFQSFSDLCLDDFLDEEEEKEPEKQAFISSLVDFLDDDEFLDDSEFKKMCTEWQASIDAVVGGTKEEVEFKTSLASLFSSFTDLLTRKCIFDKKKCATLQQEMEQLKKMRRRVAMSAEYKLDLHDNNDNSGEPRQSGSTGHRETSAEWRHRRQNVRIPKASRTAEEEIPRMIPCHTETLVGVGGAIRKCTKLCRTYLPRRWRHRRGRRTFGTARKKVVMILCLLGSVITSLVFNSYFSMLAYAPDFGSQPNPMNEIPERQCSSLEYSVPFPFGGCAVTAATPSNSVGSAETCGLCGQNKLVLFLTKVGENLKEKKGKECSKLAIFGVAFGDKYESMMMKNPAVIDEMNAKHGKCFFTFVLDEDDDGAMQSQNYTQSTYLGIKIPVPRAVLPYENMRRNTKLFKMYGGLMVFSFAERLIWQDVKLDNKLHHTRDYNNYFKEHIDKNGVCAALFSLPKHPYTLGKSTWRNVDGPHFKDHCNLLTSTSGIKRWLPYTDSREAIQLQCDYYQKLNSTSYGSSLDSGLIDSALMAWDMRTERCRKFNQRLSCTWLDETQCHGDRDQVSFPQAIRTMELHEPRYVSPRKAMAQDKLFVSDDEQQKPLVSTMLLP
jgi:hypothetical protein